MDKADSPLIIAIDGPAGVGKSTLAGLLAQSLGLPYLDTGAMFRCIALRLGQAGLNLPDDELRGLCGKWTFSLRGKGENSTLLFEGQAPDPAIRSEAVSALASKYAANPVVREILLRDERAIGAETSLVADGRDIGTVVFPHAAFKFFLEADPGVRANRRWLQLAEKGEKADLAELEKKIRQRDQRDRERAAAPLRPAPDAIIIDTSRFNIQQVLETMLEHIRKAD